MNRQQWIAMLAKLVAPMEAARAASALADMLPLLADFPDTAFSLRSLEHVATQCGRFVPSYAQLREHLASYGKSLYELPERHYPLLPSPPRDTSKPYDPGPAPEWCFERGPALKTTGRSAGSTINAQSRYLTRAELNEVYRREGVKGPQVPEPVRAAASIIPMPVKRGPPIDDAAE